jgi:uncharacterized repeat protein (TIGR01451 family)
VYTLSVANAGPDTANQVHMIDALPDGLSLNTAQASQGSCNGAQIVTCNLGDLAGGLSAAVVIEVTPMSVGTVVNTATVQSLQFDPNVSNNVVSHTTQILPGRDLVVTQTDWPDPLPAPGQPVTYTVRVFNTGPFTTTGVSLIDTLLANADFGSITTDRGSCSTPNPVLCDLGEMGPSTSATVTLVVTPTLVGVYANQADVSGNEFEADLSNNSTIEYTTVGSADLVLLKTVWPASVEVGQPMTYTLIVTATGPVVATNVVVTDALPGSVQLISVAASPGQCSGTSMLVCNLGA